MFRINNAIDEARCKDLATNFNDQVSIVFISRNSYAPLLELILLE